MCATDVVFDQMKLHNRNILLISIIILLTACSSEPSTKDINKYPISKDVLQESIDLGMNIIVDTELFNEPIRLSDYKNNILLAKDCDGQILKINQEDVIKAWAEYSTYKCNNSFTELTLKKSTISESKTTVPVAEIDLFAASIHETVQLDGNDSYDPGGSKLAFQWGLISTPLESSAVIDNPTSPSPSFITSPGSTFIAL